MKRSLLLLSTTLAAALVAGCTSSSNQTLSPSHVATDPAPYPGPMLVKDKPETFVGEQPGEAVLAVTIDGTEQVKNVSLIRATDGKKGRNALISAKTFGPATGVPAGVYTYKIMYAADSLPPSSTTPDTYWVWYPKGRDLFLK